MHNNKLIGQVADEQNEAFRPKLTSHIENLDDADQNRKPTLRKSDNDRLLIRSFYGFKKMRGKTK